jgi:predicted DNA-binding antitoxin AbrB/MazE fold protein
MTKLSFYSADLFQKFLSVAAKLGLECLPKELTTMSLIIEAIYESGVLKPLAPLPELQEHERVRLMLEPQVNLYNHQSPAVASTRLLADELIALLNSAPSLEQIIQFKISPTAQERLEALLDKNREAQLTAAEQRELDQYLQYRHILIVLKAGARRALAAHA